MGLFPIVVRVLVTGRPGVGKTTAVVRAVEILRARGLRVGGMVSVEVREAGRRVGFRVRDVGTGEEGWLARVGAGGGPRVGRYVVVLADLERVGVGAILRAVEGADVVVVDEIGPMELFSQAFRRAVVAALDSGKPVVATMHYRASAHPFGRSVLSRAGVRVVRVDVGNRDRVPWEIVRLVLA